MNIYTVSLFGHRRLSDPFKAEQKLHTIVQDLLLQKEYVDFLIGRDGEFDILAASVIRNCKKQFASGNASLILILPYERAEYRDNKDSFEAYYDEIEIYPGERTYFKAAIEQRNHYMAERADLVICCIEHESGGAYSAVKYAEKLKKKTTNIFES